MALNNAPDKDWTGPLRVAAKTADDGTPISAGIVPPKLTTAERDALTEVESGMVIYNTTTNKLNVRVAAAWEAVTSA